MIDKFALLVTHGLMLLVAWRLLSRPDLHETEQEVAARTNSDTEARPQ